MKITYYFLLLCATLVSCLPARAMRVESRAQEKTIAVARVSSFSNDQKYINGLTQMIQGKTGHVVKPCTGSLAGVDCLTVVWVEHGRFMDGTEGIVDKLPAGYQAVPLKILLIADTEPARSTEASVNYLQSPDYSQKPAVINLRKTFNAIYRLPVLMDWSTGDFLSPMDEKYRLLKVDTMIEQLIGSISAQSAPLKVAAFVQTDTRERQEKKQSKKEPNVQVSRIPAPMDEAAQKRERLEQIQREKELLIQKRLAEIRIKKEALQKEIAAGKSCIAVIDNCYNNRGQVMAYAHELLGQINQTARTKIELASLDRCKEAKSLVLFTMGDGRCSENLPKVIKNLSPELMAIPYKILVLTVGDLCDAQTADFITNKVKTWDPILDSFNEVVFCPLLFGSGGLLMPSEPAYKDRRFSETMAQIAQHLNDR